MALKLRCTAGPLAGQILEVETELVLGRELPRPGELGGDPRLSRRHARIYVDGGGRVAVEDLGSTNGTWVNGERLTEPRFLDDGDELRLGQTCCEVEIPPPPPAATQPDTAPPIAARTVEDAGPAQPSLRVIAGPLEGEEIPVGDELLIGRGFGEPGALGGDRLLSRRHARIARGRGGVFFIEDTGSTNGTKLNGQQVRGAHPLKDGDEIKVGTSVLMANGFPRAPLTPELDQAEAGGFGRGDASRDRAGTGARELAPQGAAPARLSPRRVTAVFAGVFAAAAVLAVAVVLVAAPLGSSACAQGFICHKPPTAPPLRSLATFTGSLGWRAEYDSQLAAPATANVGGNELVLHETSAGDQILGAPPGSHAIGIWIRGYPASQFSAQAALQNMVNAVGAALVGATAAPNSDQMFGIPVLGFHTAAGRVVEGNARTPQGPGGLVKVAVMSASSGRVTVVAAAAYAIQQGTSQGTNPDEPFDRFADTVLETVRFPSDGGA